MEKRKCFFKIREVAFDRPTKIRYVTPPKNNNFLPAIEQKLSVLARILANHSEVRRVRWPNKNRHQGDVSQLPNTLMDQINIQF